MIIKNIFFNLKYLDNVKFEGFEWDEKKEKTYQSLANNVKRIFNDELKHSNFGCVGIYMFILVNYKMGLNFGDLDNKQPSRDVLMDKFLNGDHLSENELLFLINTSTLLNSCIDKKFIKSVIEVTNKDII